MKISHLVVTFGACHVGVDAIKLLARTPADATNVMMTAYPIGNGKQAGLPLGVPGNDVLYVNHDSLWQGGPFSNPAYAGGNPNSSLAHFLSGIQEWIFQNGTGNESSLYGSPADYGSYEMLGRLTVNIAGINNYTNYKRSLDLETAVHATSFIYNGASFSTSQFCSYPDGVCVYHINSSKALPHITVGMVDTIRSSPASTSRCCADGVHLSGRTQADPGLGEIGMKFDALVQVVSPQSIKKSCNADNEMVIAASSQKSVSLIIATGTEYDPSKGNAADNYSFKGPEPYPTIRETVKKAVKKDYNEIKNAHTADHKSWFDLFRLELPDPNNSADIDTSTLLAQYTTEQGDPFIENLVVDYGKYLYIASSRPGSLPPNLQGKWAASVDSAWSSDYHIDINVQMNNWHAEQMGLGDLMEPLFDFITQTWQPRGTESAKLWYDVRGWVAFTNLNIFGHTGQEDDATWSDVQHDIAWMMAYVWDRYDYGRNVEWYQNVGYPILKPVAQFWLDMLVQDEYFKDGTLVANPCNSPEQGPTTFGCAQSQQTVWELFDHVVKGWKASGDTDERFQKNVKDALQKIDQGVHVGSWGQIQEWKIDMDIENNTHRHLSHLTGWYPGYVISGLHGDNKTITDAVATSLYSRGNGTEDSNTGWEKVWRSAAWARLGIVDEAYTEFKYTIDMNFAPNALSVYATTDGWPYTQIPPFQVDANFGIAGAALAMLSTDIAQWSGDNNVQKVVLGPAIPHEWAGGSVKGLKLRGGGSVDFAWTDDGTVHTATLRDRKLPITIVNKNGIVLARV